MIFFTTSFTRPFINIMASDLDSREEWQAFRCDCFQKCNVYRHQLVQQVDETKYPDIFGERVDFAFFESLKEEDIRHVVKLEMEQEEGKRGRDGIATSTGAHDDDKNYFQRGLKTKVDRRQQTWPLGPIHLKARTNPRTIRREVKLSFLISKGFEHEMFQSNLDILFYKRRTWECRRPQKVVENLRTGQLERLTWNSHIGMEFFESDYEIMRNPEGWKKCPDHSFAKIMTRLFPVISVALLREHQPSYTVKRKSNQFEKVTFENQVHHERCGECHMPKGVRNLSGHLMHHQGACVGSVALPPSKIKLHEGSTDFADISEDHHYNMWWDKVEDGQKMEIPNIGREHLEPFVFIRVGMAAMNDYWGSFL